jgi:hypothetical protein
MLEEEQKSSYSLLTERFVKAEQKLGAGSRLRRFLASQTAAARDTETKGFGSANIIDLV